MLEKLTNLTQRKLSATDEPIGKLADFIFDSQSWNVRYIVVDTGTWLSDKKVLVSPLHLVSSMREMDSNEPLKFSLTKKQIENCPELDRDAPVSRRYEIEYARNYNQQPYWDDILSLELQPNPAFHTAIRSFDPDAFNEHEKRLEDIEACNLRSAHEIAGYKASTEDKSFGQVDDFILDYSNWKLSHMIVDSGNWLSRKKIFVSVNWIKDFNWNEKTTHVKLSSSQIELAPGFDEEVDINNLQELGKTHANVSKTISSLQN